MRERERERENGRERERDRGGGENDDGYWMHQGKQRKKNTQLYLHSIDAR
jgi:hypothetical protein